MFFHPLPLSTRPAIRVRQRDAPIAAGWNRLRVSARWICVLAHQHSRPSPTRSVQAGRWQGPWATAKALEQACQAHAGVLPDAQLHIKVLDEPGGGVPQFYPGRCAVQGCSVWVIA